MLHTITYPDGSRLVVNVEDIVTMREEQTDDGAGLVKIRLRTGDVETVPDQHREVVDAIIQHAQLGCTVPD